MKNPFPIFFLILLAIVLAYGYYSIWGGFEAAPRPPSAPHGGSQSCIDGQTQYCKVGNCSGLSTCVGGAWGGCRWERLCSPGSRVTCLKNNCPYAIKECDECGTGYGPCTGLVSGWG